MASLALVASCQAACLPLDDLSSYSSAWETPSPGAALEGALDASTSAGERGDGGTTEDGAGIPADASDPLAAAPDASPSEPAPDAGEPAVSRDGGSALDAGAADAAP